MHVLCAACTLCWKEEAIHSIDVPALIIIGDNDIVSPEHAVEMFRWLPRARLSILPGIHGIRLL
jgi:pimeloyl-ACP methyl ester carboxylesterase